MLIISQKNHDKGIYPLALSRHCEARSNPVSHKMFIPLKKRKIHLLRIWIASGYRPRNDGSTGEKFFAPTIRTIQQGVLSPCRTVKEIY
jgi:hypothetical protein